MRRDAGRQMETKRCKMKKRSASGGASTKGRGDGRRRNRQTDETEGGESDGGEREESGFCNRPPLPRVKRLNVCLLTCRALPLFVYLVANGIIFSSRRLETPEEAERTLGARLCQGSSFSSPSLKAKMEGGGKALGGRQSQRTACLNARRKISPAGNL